MEAIMAVFDAARKIMADSGNTNQWKNGYPSEEIVLSDMEKDGGYVIEDGGQVVGYFAFLPSPEPTYSKIYDGEWVDDADILDIFFGWNPKFFDETLGKVRGTAKAYLIHDFGNCEPVLF